jgi:hypothetical protein
MGNLLWGGIIRRRKSLGREDRASGGGLQEAEETRGIMSLGSYGHRKRIDDRGMQIAWEGSGDLDPGLGRRIRGVDDAEPDEGHEH